MNNHKNNQVKISGKTFSNKEVFKMYLLLETYSHPKTGVWFRKKLSFVRLFSHAYFIQLNVSHRDEPEKLKRGNGPGSHKLPHEAMWAEGGKLSSLSYLTLDK